MKIDKKKIKIKKSYKFGPEPAGVSKTNVLRPKSRMTLLRSPS